MLNWTMSNVYGLSPGDVSHSLGAPLGLDPSHKPHKHLPVSSCDLLQVWWAASDLGWVVGHSYICYAPLLHGNSTILYEVCLSDAAVFTLARNPSQRHTGHDGALGHWILWVLE